jgi:hypothetical protein
VNLGNERGPGPWRSRPQAGVARRSRAESSHLLVRYESQTPDQYLVRDLAGDEMIEVPKRYASPVPFPVTPRPHQRGARLLRWSAWALAGAWFGGALGVALGTLVVLVALLQLSEFGGRVRRWRRQGPSSDEAPGLLPAAAAMERQRLRAALGQGLLAVLLGAGVMALLLPYLGPHLLRYLR